MHEPVSVYRGRGKDNYGLIVKTTQSHGIPPDTVEVFGEILERLGPSEMKAYLELYPEK